MGGHLPEGSTVGGEIVERLLKQPVLCGVFFFIPTYFHLLGVVGSRKSGLDGGLGILVGFGLVWLFFEELTRWRPAWKLELPKLLWGATFLIGAAAVIVELTYVSANQVIFLEGVAASVVFLAGFSLVMMAAMRAMDALFSRVAD